MSNYNIICAAADTPEKLKNKADYICDAADARPVMQQAIDEADALGVSCVLLKGTYTINSAGERSPKGGICFYNTDAGKKFYCQNKARYHVLEGAKAPLGWKDGAIVTMGKEFYDSLSDDETFSLFYNSGNNIYARALMIKNIIVRLPGNYKPVIVFDGRFASAVRYEDCWACALDIDAVDYATAEGMPMPNPKSVGFRGCCGSNFYSTEWKNCAVQGFGTGFDIGGEHVYCESLSALYNIYGFAFDCYKGRDLIDLPDDTPGRGICMYPVTCVNLLDEHNVHMPRFGNMSQGGGKGMEQWGEHIKILGMNLQWPNTCPGYTADMRGTPEFTEGRHRATEMNPGTWRGSIEYVIDYVEHGGHANICMDPFFEEGHGENIVAENIHRRLKK